MTDVESTVRPPVVTERVVELFCSSGEADEILGDLAEEIAQRAHADGISAARREYRRQAWRTILDLAFSPVRGLELTSRSLSWPRVVVAIVSAMAIGIIGALMAALIIALLTLPLPLKNVRPEIQEQLLKTLLPMAVTLVTVVVFATLFTVAWSNSRMIRPLRLHVVFIATELTFLSLLTLGGAIGRMTPWRRHPSSAGQHARA